MFAILHVIKRVGVGTVSSVETGFSQSSGATFEGAFAFTHSADSSDFLNSSSISWRLSEVICECRLYVGEGEAREHAHNLIGDVAAFSMGFS
jgi:hypothetical protein